MSEEPLTGSEEPDAVSRVVAALRNLVDVGTELRRRTMFDRPSEERTRFAAALILAIHALQLRDEEAARKKPLENSPMTQEQAGMTQEQAAANEVLRLLRELKTAARTAYNLGLRVSFSTGGITAQDMRRADPPPMLEVDIAMPVVASRPLS
jgi:hypothetical protein